LIPRVGYSLYKTDPSQVNRCISLALSAGVRHFDLASLYNSNEQVGASLQSYITTGIIPETTIINTKSNENKKNDSINVSPTNSQRKRREELFLSHKVSNQEQSTSKEDVKKAVRDEIKKLQVEYLDLCSIHSPLTKKEKRLATYEALLELKEEHLIRTVGVCNYGVYPLDEILSAGLPAPSIIQLELSPFNQHEDVAQWARDHEVLLSCATWSKLSSISGPQEGWATVSAMAKEKGVSKQQILIRWALHKGYTCVPRSGVGSKIERQAIAENSFKGVGSFALSKTDVHLLDKLDENLKAGKLGRRDGWGDEDVKGEDWDPTSFVRS